MNLSKTHGSLICAMLKITLVYLYFLNIFILNILYLRKLTYLFCDFELNYTQNFDCLQTV